MILFQKTHAFLLLCGAILLLAVGCQHKELDRADADILYLQVEDPLPETRVAFNDVTGAFAWAALNATTHKSYYTSSSTYNYRRKNGRYSHGTAIQEPFVMYTAASNVDPRDWSSKYHFDSWDSMYNSSLPTKTIYDPCPVGFLVPPKEAFSGFTDETTTWSSSTPKGLTYTDSGLFFPAFGELDRCNYDNGATNDIERYGEAGYYTTCSPSDYQQDRVRLFFDSNKIAVDGNGKGNGQLVRPAKER